MPEWIQLDGLVNLRDVGGVPTTDGGVITSGVLLRSDNLQDLSDADLAELARRDLTDVVDLRSDIEVTSTGPGPMTRQPGVRIHHHSMFIERHHTGRPVTSADPQTAPEPVDPQPADTASDQARANDPLPWAGLAQSQDHQDPITAHYLSYLADRPDSAVAALRVIAGATGATLVHCAAGKDRTGTVVALALLLAGAEPAAVVADYAATTERIELILDRLIATDIYRSNLVGRPVASHNARPEVMRALITHINTRLGGVEPMLAAMGWTATDTRNLRGRLRADRHVRSGS